MFLPQSYGYGQPASEAKLICESSHLSHGITTVTNPRLPLADVLSLWCFLYAPAPIP